MTRSAEIAREHAAMRAVMGDVRVALDELAQRPARPGDEWDLPALLRSFRERLYRHFALEERGGLLGDAALDFEAGSEQIVRSLIDEHREFERSVERVLTGLDGDFVPPVIVQRCYESDLRKLLAGLARHEAAEAALLERLVGEDARAGEPSG